MKFEIVCFDCDSTLSAIEGIDELARRVGLGEQMAALTHAAMNGEVPLQAVYAQRLDAIRPDRAAIAWVADLYIAQLVDGAREAVSQLQEQGAKVHIISGGLRQAILPLAQFLGIPAEQVHAVDVYFNTNGSYQDFDRTALLAQTGGKAKVCRQLNPKQHTLAMIGDGQTDLEAQQAGAVVIGFGGVVARPAVQAQADYFVSDARLDGVLRYILD